MKRKIRTALVLLFLIVSILIGSYLFRLAHPYSLILHCNGEDQISYIIFYEKILSTKKMEYLLTDLINSNDVRTINIVSEYCNRNSICDKLNLLEKKANELYALPKDSVWTINIDFSYSRESSVEMLYLPNNLQKNIDLLKAKCKNK